LKLKKTKFFFREFGFFVLQALVTLFISDTFDISNTINEKPFKVD